MKSVIVTGSFDKIQSSHVRFLEEASKSGFLHVFLWSDEIVRRMEGAYPQFPQEERTYFLNSIRYTNRVTLVNKIATADDLPLIEEFQPDIWAVDENDHTPQKRQYCATQGIEYRIIHHEDMCGFPALPSGNGVPSTHTKVLVTGSYDWFHSGHVRFFEETSGLGDLYVVVGHDENIRLLKGEGHPFFSQDERGYMVQSIRFVKQTLISTGHGWMDAEPEIEKIKPDIYAVNEDGDKPAKREFCREHGIEYLVLKRTPKEGLPHRESTVLRG
jgi:cytidyltransferase-like protein